MDLTDSQARLRARSVQQVEALRPLVTANGQGAVDVVLRHLEALGSEQPSEVTAVQHLRLAALELGRIEVCVAAAAEDLFDELTEGIIELSVAFGSPIDHEAMWHLWPKG